jgi:hypothetical protein
MLLPKRRDKRQLRFGEGFQQLGDLGDYSL